MFLTYLTPLLMELCCHTNAFQNHFIRALVSTPSRPETPEGRVCLALLCALGRWSEEISLSWRLGWGLLLPLPAPCSLVLAVPLLWYCWGTVGWSHTRAHGEHSLPHTSPQGCAPLRVLLAPYVRTGCIHLGQLVLREARPHQPFWEIVILGINSLQQ
jgi:hypothetical protein